MSQCNTLIFSYLILIKMVFGNIIMMLLSCLGISKLKDKDSPLLLLPSSSNSNSNANSSNDSNIEEKEEEILVGLEGSRKIRVNDGRYLAYIERGVAKEVSKFKLVIIHGFASSKDINFLPSQDFLDELGLYVLLYDRAGYGESDPIPTRSMESESSDIEELTNQLHLGPKFYVLGVSLGCYPAWSCINRIPDRLAGVALVAPIINYNWPSLPSNLIKDDYRKNLSRWAVLLSRYTPGLLHWWMTQSVFPSSSIIDGNPAFFSNKDLEVLKNTPGYQLLSQNKLKDRVVFDSLRHDFIVAFSKWDFDPLSLTEMYPKNESYIHIWQGYEDKVIPYPLQRFVSKKLPWINYHEVPEGGHLLVYDTSVCEAILKSLLLGEDFPLYRPK